MKGRAGQKDPRAERGDENYRENRGACEFDGSAKCQKPRRVRCNIVEHFYRTSSKST